MLEIKVLGIGSPFSVDQLGWEVVHYLQKKECLKPYQPHRLQISWHDRPGLLLLELMREAATVFLIDAVKSGASSGTLHRFQKECLDPVNPVFSTHDMGVIAALHMGKALDCLPENILFWGCEVEAIAWDMKWPPEFNAAVERLGELIVQEILEILLPSQQ